MKKYFLFIDGDNDVAMYDVDNLQSATCASNTETLLKFAPGSLGVGQAASVDVIALTHTAGGEITIMKALARAANATGPQYSDGLIVVADDVNGIYLDSSISAVGIALDA